jgi:hypothetical protein
LKERRKFQRTAVELPAFYSVSGSEQLKHRATVINMSAGGFCFYAQQPMELETPVELTVKLEGDDLSLSVLTAWSKRIGDTGDYMIGVRISDAGGSDLEKFLKFYCREISHLINDLQQIKKS